MHPILSNSVGKITGLAMGLRPKRDHGSLSPMLRRLWPLALLALLILAFLLRRDSPRPPSPPPPQEVDPSVPDAPPTPAAPRAAAAPATPPAPERLRPFLERLGRATLLRDVRRRAELKPPEIFESDLPWLRAQLRGELLAAAGAAQLLPVPEIADVLREPGRVLLKDALIDRLARAGGDAAHAALATALREDVEPDVRARCARALAAFPAGHTALALALKDPALDVRRAAAAALGSGEHLQALFDALLVEPEPAVQREIVRIFDRHLPEDVVAQVTRFLPEARWAELDASRANLAARAWPLGFFAPGGAVVPFDASRGRRVGLTVELGGIKMADVAQAIFSEPPFDRYREWFYLRDEKDFPSTDAYDFLGRPLRDVARGELEGTVYLRFRDPAHFREGVLGYARGCEAFVQRVSLLHELGHALGGLGDEYAGGSPPPHANVSAAREAPWMSLVRDGHLPGPVEREKGVWVPSESCHMNNVPNAPVRFCAACQVALIQTIVRLTDAPAPAR